MSEWTQDRRLEEVRASQVAVYVMCGGGFLGKFAAEQPADFYIDVRCGKRPYPVKTIYKAVKALAEYAEEAGLDPHNLPAMPFFRNLGGTF